MGPTTDTALPGAYAKDLGDLNEPEGYIGWWVGENVIDWTVRPGEMANTTMIADPEADPSASPSPLPVLQGDAYTIVVDCFNQTCSYTLTGYYPHYMSPTVSGDPAGQTWATANGLGGGVPDPFFDPNWYEQKFSHVGTLIAPPYGGPDAFYVTSEGTINQWVRWPVNPKTRTFTYDATSPYLGYDPANAFLGEVDAYMYDSAWTTQAYNQAGIPSTGSGTGSWDPAWKVSPSPDPSPWTDPNYGDSNAVTLTSPDDINQSFYCYPSFWVANAYNPAKSIDDLGAMYAGDPSTLGEGTFTLKYLQEVTYPTDLQIANKVPSSVVKGTYVTFSGTFGIGSEMSATGWAAKGVPVHIQLFKGNKVLAQSPAFKVGDNGVWSGKIKLTVTGEKETYRAFSASPGNGAGYDEYSNVKVITVK